METAKSLWLIEKKYGIGLSNSAEIPNEFWKCSHVRNFVRFQRQTWQTKASWMSFFLWEVYSNFKILIGEEV